MTINLIIFILTLINFAFQLDFVILMPLGQIIMDQFQISPIEFSAVISVYTLASGISSLLYSIFGAKWNKKIILLISIFALSISGFITGVTTTFYELFIMRCISGGISGILNALIFSIATEHIPHRQRGKAMAWILSGFSLASVFGVPIGLYLTDHFGFKITYFSIALIFFIVLLGSIIILPNDHKREFVQINLMIRNFLDCVKNVNYWKGYLLLFFISGAIFVIVPLLSPFAIKNLGMKMTNLEQMYLCGGILTVFTSRIIGNFCDKYGPKKLLNLVSLLSVFPIVIFVNSTDNNGVYFIILGSLMMALMSGLMVPSMTIASFIPTNADISAFNGILNSVRNLGASFFSYLAGLLMITDLATGKFINFYLLGFIYIILMMIVIYIGLTFSRVKTQKN